MHILNPEAADQRGHMEKYNGRGGSAKCNLFDCDRNRRCGRCTRAYLNDKSDPKTEASHALTSGVQLAMLLILTVSAIQIDYRKRNE